MTEKRFLKGLLAAMFVLWVGCVYVLARSLFTQAGWWEVLALCIICVQGLLVLYMAAHRFRYGVPEPYPAVRTASSALTWVGLLFVLYALYGPRVLGLVGQ